MRGCQQAPPGFVECGGHGVEVFEDARGVLDGGRRSIVKLAPGVGNPGLRRVVHPNPSFPDPIHSASGVGPGRPDAGRAGSYPSCYGRASKIRLNGVSAARRKRLSPPAVTTARSCASVATVASAMPWPAESALGVQTSTEAAE